MAKRKAQAPASDRVRREWLRRVEAEYRSAAITQHLGLWLTRLGASPDLVRLSLRVATDEVDHAELSWETFVAAGGEGGPVLAQETLGLSAPEGEPLELSVTRSCVADFCLGETVAVRLFKALRERCDVPIARAVLDRVLLDEVRHRDFGWALLGWLLEQPYGPAVRRFVEDGLPRWLGDKRAAYASAGAAATDHLYTDDDLRWGLMPARRYAEILETTVRTDYARRFAKLGLSMPTG